MRLGVGVQKGNMGFILYGFPGGANGKESAYQCRRCKRHRLNPWVGKIPRGGNGNPLQYACLENPMDRGAWRATVHTVPQSWTQLSTEHKACTMVLLCLTAEMPDCFLK